MYFNHLNENNSQSRGPEADTSPMIKNGQISSSEDPESVLRFGWKEYFRRSFSFLLWHKLAILLVFVPVAIICEASHASSGVIFVTCMLGLIPLANMLGDITEQLALHTNETIGGLLNATFGNATEAIVAIFAIKAGLLRLVQVSLVGSVLSNLLLVLGCAFLAGGVKHKELKINTAVTVTSTGLLFLVAVCLSIVTIMKWSNSFSDPSQELTLSRIISVFMLAGYGLFLYFQLHTHLHLFEDEGDDDEEQDGDGAGGNQGQAAGAAECERRSLTSAAAEDANESSAAEESMNFDEPISLEMSPLGHVTVSPRHSHSHNNDGDGHTTPRQLAPVSQLQDGDDAKEMGVVSMSLSSSSAQGEAEAEGEGQTEGDDDDDDEEEKILGPWGAVGFMCFVTIFIALLSEYIVNAIDGAARSLSMPNIFIGTILLPIVGNAAEHASAVTVAYKGKINLAMGVAIGSAIQIALFCIPLMVIIAALAGQPLSLDFHAFEMACVYSSVLLVGFLISDGKSNWLKGALLLFLYAAISAAFFYHKED